MSRALLSAARRSMSETYIPLFLDSGGDLLADTRVLRLARQRHGWEVHALHKGSRPLLIRADRVFVCAGAVHSPCAAATQRHKPQYRQEVVVAADGQGNRRVS